MQTRPATLDDFPAILALNQAWVHYINALDRMRLQLLLEIAALHRVEESDRAAIAFLLALRDAAEYDSVNYEWFAQRYLCFLYEGRLVESGRVRSAGAARCVSLQMADCAPTLEVTGRAELAGEVQACQW